jgi:thymidylate synthase
VKHHTVADVRSWFRDLKSREDYVTDKTGVKMLEVIGATFVADEETIFAPVNHDYVKREVEWYDGQSLNVNDIPGGAPAAWKGCASKEGFINSNYGHLVYGEANHRQYQHVLEELRQHPFSRRAEMVYTRPSIWNEYNRNGMSDFICTDAVQYVVRNSRLQALVRMRSNDVVWGFRNDYAWQKVVQLRLASDLQVEPGDIIWHAGSLHVYERHFSHIK